MKKILFALAILPILAFVSCSSDDDDKLDIQEPDFAHNIELLYGQWRATGVELGELTIDLTGTDEEGELIFVPTYVSFAEDGSFSSEGIIGEATGKYTTKDKTIITDIGEDKEDKLSFEMTNLTKETAEIVVDASAFNLDMIPDELGEVTVVLTKQEKEDNEKEEEE
ncbi:MAG: hypothetical protein GX921_07615 [Bacteroidales bacterium]|nr:hypothetical protein [Bacteroidales bacterium]